MISRIGMGFDIHRLVDNRKLILGGVEIDFPRGLEGHSDADVLTHAIGDALLGAAALGDLGQHFPETDPLFKNISSLELLQRILGLIQHRDFRIVNIDATIIAEAPKLAPFFGVIGRKLSETLQISPEQINLKAKTHEKLDTIGQGQAIAVHAVAMIEKK